MKKVKRKNKKKFNKLYILTIFIIIVIISLICFCFINTLAISTKSKKVTIKIESGSSIKNIVHILKENDLIRNEYFTLVYIKLNNINDLKAGEYLLNKNLTPKEIFSILNKGSNIKEETLKITFNEGKNMRGIAKIIDENTVNNYEDVFDLLKDKEYIKTLIDEYWFLEDVILDENIYYPLEGYLAPNTYEFKMDASTKDIFKKMLDQTKIILDEYKTKIENSGYSVHEILTLASMVENEGVTLDDRKDIAGVFINRLNANMSLGSDVTTYYAFRIDLGERDLKVSEINSDNPYNTRSSTNAGKLPIGPICNPSKEAIISVVEYNKNDYYYFVADKNMRVYFTENSSEHTRIIKELKSKNLWYEY